MRAPTIKVDRLPFLFLLPQSAAICSSRKSRLPPRKRVFKEGRNRQVSNRLRGFAHRRCLVRRKTPFAFPTRRAIIDT